MLRADAGAALQDLLDVELRQVGLTPLEIEVLRRLSAQPGSSEALLAEKLWVKRQSVYRVVAWLRAAGLVDSERSEVDRRTVGLALTSLAWKRASSDDSRTKIAPRSSSASTAPPSAPARRKSTDSGR